MLHMTQICLKNRINLKALWAGDSSRASILREDSILLFGLKAFRKLLASPFAKGHKQKHTKASRWSPTEKRKANKAFKSLSFGKRHKSAGRNASGSITMAHRGGGSKRLQRRIDFRRSPSDLAPLFSYGRSRWPQATPLGRSESPIFWKETSSAESEGTTKGSKERYEAALIGKIERIEYDPNRSSRIALVRWIISQKVWNSAANKLQHQEAFTYILASADLKVGDTIRNDPKRGTRQRSTSLGDQRAEVRGASFFSLERQTYDTLCQQVGNCMPLSQIPIGTLIHNLEWHPGQGGKLVRAAGTFARLVQRLDTTYQSIVRLPSGVTKLLDSRCRATIGVVSNLANNTIRLTKAGQTRWLGQRPTVRGVAMNPIDHPHGGGEGRTKGGRPSVSPWGKPTKGGFKTVVKKRHQ